MAQIHQSEAPSGAVAVLPNPAQNEFLRTLARSFPEPAFVIDDDGTIRMWNEKMIEFIGYSADEVIGREAYDVFQTDGESQTLAEEIVERGTVVREQQIRTAEGKSGDVVTRAKGIPLRGENGEIVGAIEILGRVTELVESREQIQNL